MNEGLAEVFAASIIGDKTIQIGILDRAHRRYLGQTKLMNLDDLVDPDKAFAAYRDRSTRHQFYAQAWALTHYFMMGDDGARWPQLVQYLERLAAGADEETTWRELLGTRRDVTKKLWKYLNRTKFTSLIIESGVKIDGDSFSARALTDAEVLAYRGDFLTRGRDRALAGQLLAPGHRRRTTARPWRTKDSATLRCRPRCTTRPATTWSVRYDWIRTGTWRTTTSLTIERRERKDGWPERAERHLLDAIHIADWFAAGASPARTALRCGRQHPLPEPWSSPSAHSGTTRATRFSHLLYSRLLRESGKEGLRCARRCTLRRPTSPTCRPTPTIANEICWRGTLDGLASDVYASCETAVRRRPEDRGEPRTVAPSPAPSSANLEGAAEDLRKVLETDALDEDRRKQRAAWLSELEAGAQPARRRDAPRAAPPVLRAPKPGDGGRAGGQTTSCQRREALCPVALALLGISLVLANRRAGTTSWLFESPLS